MTANPKITRKTMDMERQTRLNIIPNVQSIEFHPFIKELVAVATQQTVSLYDLRGAFNEPFFQYEVPDGLVLAQVCFVPQITHRVQTSKDNYSVQVVGTEWALAIRFKATRFLMVINPLRNLVQKIVLQDVPLQLLAPCQEVRTMINFQLPLTPDFYNVMETEELPRQFFVALTQTELLTITPQQNWTKFQVSCKQIPVSGLKQAERPPVAAFGLTNDTVFVAQGFSVYKFRLKVTQRTNEKLFLEQQRSKSEKALQKNIKEYELFVRMTYNTKSWEKAVDMIEQPATYDYQKQLKGQIADLMIKNEFAIFATTEGLHFAELDDQGRNQMLKEVFMIAKFDNQVGLTLNYRLRENGEAEDEGSFDIYQSEKSDQILSDDEETSSSEQIQKLEHQELSGFDYFVQNAIFVVQDQKIQCKKLIKSNFQIIHHLKQVYEMVKSNQQNTDLSIQLENVFIDFGQRLAFSEQQKTVFFYTNPFTNVQVFDVAQFAKKQLRAIVELKTVTFELIRHQDLKFSRNALVSARPEKWGEMLLWARGDQLMVMRE